MQYKNTGGVVSYGAYCFFYSRCWGHPDPFQLSFMDYAHCYAPLPLFFAPKSVYNN